MKANKASNQTRESAAARFRGNICGRWLTQTLCVGKDISQMNSSIFGSFIIFNHQP